MGTEHKDFQRYRALKNEAGTHSPSMSMLQSLFPDLPKPLVDGCFIRNPLATDLFLNHLRSDLTENTALEQVISYYPSQNRAIAQYISQAISFPAEKIFVANGAVEVIQAVLQQFAKQKIIINLPTFSAYYECCRSILDVEFYNLDKADNFKLDQDKYLDFVHSSKADTVVLINPNNPDGSYLPIAEIDSLVQELQHLGCIIIDESFIHFAHEDGQLSPLSHQSLTEKYPNLVIIKSMSKDFGIAGIRAGYGLMSEDRVQHLLERGYLWNSNGFAEYFFKLWSTETFRSDYERCRKKYLNQIIHFYEPLAAIPGLKAYPTMSNFYLIETAALSAENLVEHLLFRFGVYIRSCHDKLGLEGNFIRLNVCREEENRLILTALQQLIEELS